MFTVLHYFIHSILVCAYCFSFSLLFH